MSIEDYKSWKFQDAVIYLSSGIDPKAPQDQELTKKIASLFVERVEEIEKGAACDENDLKNCAQPLVHIAAGNGKTVALFKLIERGADIDFKNDSGQTPLHWAAGQGRVEVLLELLKKGAAIKALDNERLTPLKWAFMNKEFRAALELMDQGATVDAEDIHLKDRFGQTPLHWAAGQGRVGVLLELLKKGALISAVDDEGLNPLKRAFKNGQFRAALELMDQGAIFDKEDINLKDRYGQTPLHWAAGQGRLEVLLKLLKKGAEINALDNEGLTPLKRACKNLRDETALALIEHDATFDQNDNEIIGFIREVVPKDLPLPQSITPQAQIAYLMTISAEDKKRYTLLARKILDRGWEISAKDFSPLTIAILAEEEHYRQLLMCRYESLVPIQIRFLIPHLDSLEWPLFIRPYKHNWDECQKILAYSLPSQINLLEADDLVVYNYFILEKKLDKKNNPTSNLNEIRQLQKERDEHVCKMMQDLKLTEQLEAYRSRDILKKEKIDAIEKKYFALEKAFANLIL